jgi:hypothetical protein
MRQPSWRRSALCALALAGALVACGDNNFPGEPERELWLDTHAPARVKAGEAIYVVCLVTDDDITRMVPGKIKVDDEANVQFVGDTIVARKVSTVAVQCSVPDWDLVDETPASVQIVAGDPSYVVTTITPDPVTAGETATATCEVYDSSGNPITDATPTLAITPVEAGNTITGLEAEMTRAGHYAAICELPGAQSNNAPFDVIPALPANLALAKLPNNMLHTLGEVVTITHVVTDRFGNEITNANVSVGSTGITGQGPIIALPPDAFRYNGEGRYRVTGAVTDPTDGDVPVTAELELLVNSVGPRIECNNDQTMVNMTPGAQLTLVGNANDVNGVTSIAVNGTNVAIGANNSFSAAVTTRFGMNFVDVTAVDDFGATTSKVCTFLVANRWAPGMAGDGISLKLTQEGVDDSVRTDGFDSFADILYAVLNSQGIRTALHDALNANPNLKPESCDSETCALGVCACWYSSGITYLGSNISGPNTVSLTLINGGLRVNARINGVGVNLRVKGKVGPVPYDTSGWVTMSYVDVAVDLDVALAGGRPHITVRGGTAVAMVGSISTAFNGVDGWIINNIVTPLAQGSLRNAVANAIRGFVTDNFNGVLDGVISGLDISTLGASFNVPRLDGSGNVPLGFGIGFTTLGATSSRLLFGIGTNFTSTPANAYTTLGTALPPGVNLTDPTLTSPQTMGVGAHVGLINQALHALWKANYFSVTLDGAALAGLPQGIELIVDAKLPPVAFLNLDGTLGLHLGALQAEITHPDLPAGVVITLGADAHAAVTLMGNDLRFSGIVIDRLYLSIESVAVTADQQMALEDALTAILQQIVTQSLNNALPALPIPSFALPASLTQYGLPMGGRLGIISPALTSAPHHFTLRGKFGVQ